MKRDAVRTIRKIFKRKPRLGRLRVLKNYLGLLKHLKFSGDVKRARLFGHPISYDSAGLLLFLFDEIFVEEHYRYEAPTDSPRIIDAGANIGMAALYFKLLYPQSRIVCIEPTGASYKLLKQNVGSLSGVETRQLALAAKQGTIDFTVSNALDGGDLAASASKYDVLGKLGHQESDIKHERVPTDSLNRFLEEPVDLLKMDIEGAEGEVLEAARRNLGKISRIFLEHHELPNNLSLTETERLLKSAGFSVTVTDQGTSKEAPGFAYAIIDARNAKTTSKN